jgi:hypothetical protein
VSTFTIEVICKDGSVDHSHTITIEPGRSGVFGAAKPSNVRIQYTCPRTGNALIAMFKPPLGAARPFVVTEVK